jgi:hypothetical protein
VLAATRLSHEGIEKSGGDWVVKASCAGVDDTVLCRRVSAVLARFGLQSLIIHSRNGDSVALLEDEISLVRSESEILECPPERRALRLQLLAA